MSADYNVTLVFGPNAVTAALALQDGGMPNVTAAVDAAGLRSAPMGKGEIVLAFAHNLPEAWADKDIQKGWAQSLLEGTGMGMVALMFPDVQIVANKQDNAVLLMLHWRNAGSGLALKVADALERSYGAHCT